ncbi:hypothetical protein TEA_006949 [Camellia sinensis var. sinensis]|uniref:Uncharacterized protein n=1 Tax=Camellia sinensis var. sinensis TaxID=542762 RepID=A0A4S4DM21_CAMSN|nr:hypothetical protein TEA_006949 [Camellia sinensis var. sinensis]
MAETTNKQPSDEEEEEKEEDYIGDLSQFLPPETTTPSKSSAKVSANNTQISQPSVKKPKTLNWQEQRKLKRENARRRGPKYPSKLRISDSPIQHWFQVVETDRLHTRVHAGEGGFWSCGARGA